MKKSELFFTLGRIGSDFFMTAVALFSAYWLRINKYQWFDLSEPYIAIQPHEFLNLSIGMAGGMVLLFMLQGRYQFQKEKQIAPEIAKTFWGVSAAVSLLLIAFYFTRVTFFSRFIIALSWGGMIFLISFGRIMLRWIRRIFYSLNIGKTSVLVLGTGSIAQQVLEILKNKPKYNVLGVVSLDMEHDTECGGFPIIGHIEQYEEILKKQKAHQILLASNKFSEDTTAHLSQIAHRRHAQFRYIPNEIELDLASVKIETLNALPVITLLANRITGWGSFWKLILDKALALFGIIVLSPILLVIALLVKIEEPTAPIFIKIKRVGKNGKLFPCYKFRSMVPNAHKMRANLFETSNEREGGVLFKMERDPRVTKLGHIIRKTSIDELPQLWNVLRGQMSLIGPRPHLPEEVENYALDDLRILSIKPGITGYAQLHGRGGDLPFDEEVRYEVYYMQHWSLWLDLVVLLKTVWMIISKKDNAS